MKDDTKLRLDTELINDVAGGGEQRCRDGGSILPRFIYLDLRLNVIPPIPALRIFTCACACACACEALPEGSAPGWGLKSD